MPLTTDRDLIFFASSEYIDHPVDDNVRIYRNALVGRNRATGLARPLVAGDEFLGLAYRQADNTYSGHTPGGINVRLHQVVDVVHALAGLVVGDVGKDVYATDDSTLTLTPTGASRVGRITSLDGTSAARIRLQPLPSLCGRFDNAPIVQLADASQTLTLDHINRVLLIGNAAARTLTLPPVASVRAGGWIHVIKTSAAAAAVTLDGNGAETINGAASNADVDTQYEGILVLCTGSEWIVVGTPLAGEGADA